MVQYNIEDFTPGRYAEFLATAKRRFVFSSFDQPPSNLSHIILRHDLDLSVSAAHKIALIEHEHDIKSNWIAISACVRDGIVIGKSSVVGRLGGVVTKTIPENEVWAGNPARQFKR